MKVIFPIGHSFIHSRTYLVFQHKTGILVNFALFGPGQENLILPPKSQGVLLLVRSAGDSIIGMYAWELSENIGGGKVSCEEVMTAYLDHIEKVNPAVNAIVSLQDRGALTGQARERDAELSSGKARGWMHGFPQAIKDLDETKGIRTTYASPIFKDFVPAADSILVSRMKEAGSIIVGKTNTPEWGFGSHTYNQVFGATGNPYDPDKSCGGSSGGAACSLALRMQPVADGSDYMGSLRNPAGWCNVYGYRPSAGRVPNRGFELFLSDHATRGPMARCVADLALLLSTISGYDQLSPLSLDDDASIKALTPANVNDRLRADMSGKKIAWLGDWDGYLPMEDGVLALCEKALSGFPEFGVTVEKLQPPYDPAAFWEEIWLPFRHMAAITLKPYFEDPEKRKLLKPEAIYEYEGSTKYSMHDLYAAGLKRSDWYRALMKVFETYDYVAVPTAQIFPFDKTISWPAEIAGRKMDTYHRWMEVVTHWTSSGCPVAAVPAGFSEAGLPMGIQIVGRPRSDFDLLRLAYAYEERNDWFGKVKPKLLG